MGGFRGQKLFQNVAAKVRRGVKHIPSALKRGAKFVKDLPTNIAKSDTVLRKTSNTLNQIGEYGKLAGAATGFIPLVEAGMGLQAIGGKINNFRHRELANRLRGDFKSSQSIIRTLAAVHDASKGNMPGFV